MTELFDLTTSLDLWIAVAFSLLAIAVLLILWLLRRRLASTGEPIIELEKLVHCRGCGSLIPEGVRKCAFCGAWQNEPTNP